MSLAGAIFGATTIAQTVRIAVPYACAGLGGVWMPWRILTRNGATPKPVSWFALAVINVGAAVYFLCLWVFAAVGRGTPRPWDAPRRFVAVVLTARFVIPSTLPRFWSSLAKPGCSTRSQLLKYAVAMAVCFHVFVIGYEEPTLYRKFGDTYLEYKQVVTRWIPRRPRFRRALL